MCFTVYEALYPIFASLSKCKLKKCFILSSHQGIDGLKLKHILYCAMKLVKCHISPGGIM